jgi:hypothetical protein
MPVALALALLAAAPPTSPEPVLRTHCAAHAASPSNPWALAHGITAFGASFRASDGRPAAEVIVGDFARADASAPTFPPAAKDGTPVEPHPGLLVKTLVLAGLPKGRAFSTAWGKVTLAELIRRAERGFRLPPPGNEVAWAELAWTLDVLSATHVPGSGFRDAEGRTVAVDRVMDEAFAALERAQADLGRAMDAGVPRVDKRRQGLYAHPCGGLHFFQAVASWARHPAVRARWGKRLARQIDLLFYRFDSESAQYAETVRAQPGYRLAVRAQELKFHGHLLETLARLRRDGLLSPTRRQSEAIARSRALLAEAVAELEEMGAFRATDRLRQAQPQLALDLVGDACHALHGATAWR